MPVAFAHILTVKDKLISILPGNPIESGANLLLLASLEHFQESPRKLTQNYILGINLNKTI